MPAGFQPQSATFVSPTMGWAFGWAPCSAPTCAAVLRTVNAGQSWVGIPAPLVNPVGNSGQAYRIRFANTRDGWVWGPTVWATHDGGAHWHRVTIAPGSTQVSDLEAAGGSVYAYVITQTSTQNVGRLYRAAVGSDAWAPVSAVPALANHIGKITLSGTHVWVLADGPSPGYFTSPDGVHWTTRQLPCGATQGSAGGALAAANVHDLILVCTGLPGAGQQGKTVYLSTNGGVSFVVQAAGSVPLGGLLVGVAAASPSTYVISVASGGSYLYGSFNGARTWSTILGFGDGGLGLHDLGFTTSTQGFTIHGSPWYAVHARAPAAVMYLTRNGGHTWAPVRF